MDFVVGRTQRTQSATERTSDAPAPLEARLLHVREPRRRRRDPDPEQPDQRASGSAQADPPGAQVLVLLVPDGHKLPVDLSDGSYRVFLRFAKR
jgi:hypothetical protein